jgi:O-acetyl-ADP-ribose deacetylase (regulator of RNase III)
VPAIVITIGDLFKTHKQTIINTINCKGVMGAGIALRCKELYPEVYRDYVQRCAQNLVHPGEPYLYQRDRLPWVLNFPTKDHWRNPSKIEYISDGLRYLEEHYQAWGITSLATPALGCGNGGLHWAQVGPLMFHYFSRFGIPIEIYAPNGTPPEQRSEDYLRNQHATLSETPVHQLAFFDRDPKEPSQRKTRQKSPPKN